MSAVGNSFRAASATVRILASTAPAWRHPRFSYRLGEPFGDLLSPPRSLTLSIFFLHDRSSFFVNRTCMPDGTHRRGDPCGRPLPAAPAMERTRAPTRGAPTEFILSRRSQERDSLLFDPPLPVRYSLRTGKPGGRPKVVALLPLYASQDPRGHPLGAPRGLGTVRCRGHQRCCGVAARLGLSSGSDPACRGRPPGRRCSRPVRA